MCLLYYSPSSPHAQDLAGVAHDDIDPSVFSISGDERMVCCPLWPHVP